MRNILPLLYNLKKEELIAQLQETTYVVATLDIWAKPNPIQ